MFWLAAAPFVVATAWLAYELSAAPEGWQDENGFHFGRPPEFTHDKTPSTPVVEKEVDHV